jgi:hypothetical protein
MNWEAIGVIAEVVGAAAFVITLIYLAIQTRLTIKAIAETSEHTFQQGTHTAVGMYSDWRRAVLATPELAKIMVRARQEGELPDDEQILFSICFQDLFFAAAASYRSVIHGTAGYAESISVDHMVGVLKENPLALQEWRKVTPGVSGISPEFVVAVDRELNNDGDS